MLYVLLWWLKVLRKKKSSLYVKARNSLFVELSGKFNNMWHTKQNTWFFVNIYKSVP